jgi:2-iminobutanoate/2-iminopropanoate deaminase
MKREVFNPGNVKPSLPLSHAVSADGIVFISGQLPFGENGRFPNGFEAQLHQVFANFSAALSAAGSSLSGVIKTTVFLKNMNNFTELNRIYGEYFADTPPARSTIEVARLPGDALVEIEAIAMKV